MEKRRVVVTGLGAITPIGNNVEDFWAGIKAGKVGIGPITKFDATDYKVHIAAEVKDFVAKEHMDFKAAKRMELFSQYAVAAAKEAFADAGIDMEQEDSFRAGVVVGSGVGSLQQIESNYTKIVEKGPNRVSPLMVPMMISNMAAGNVSIQLGLRGKCTNVVTACASGTNCIGDAFRAIQYDDADIMVAGGTEGSICPTGVAGFAGLTALSTTEDPMKASIPFDKDRNGFVLGEGAGIVVLEELEHAKKRGAHIYAEVVGYGATGDAYHITSPAEDGAGAGMAMKLAMKEAGAAPEEITYINAHGTSTHHNDLFETRAIKYAFGDAAKNVAINSTKSMIGHLLGAAGGVEFVVCVKSILDGFIHQTVGTAVPDEECDLNYTIGAPVEKEIEYAMSNSLGFGGHNASLLLKKYVAE
ncbi:MAG: beta-ketoacyl-ACP synthase II [Hespellia sp.]|nr:beta-ketoacyl-ACP synthase II [Hespellia sp.]